MSKILFLNHASFGHLNTLLTIALQMKSEGHEVSFMLPYAKTSSNIGMIKSAEGVAGKIVANNIAMEAVRPSLSQLLYALRLPYTQGYQELKVAIKLFCAGLAHLSKQVIAKLEPGKPDVLVSDFAFFASAIAADALRIPYVTIYHSGLPFKGKTIPPFGSGLPIADNYAEIGPQFVREEQKVLGEVDAKINKVRKKYGLAPMPPHVLRTPYSGWLNLITSHEAIEAPRDNLGDNTFFIGTCFANRKNQAGSDFPFAKLQPDKYKIYVSLGTVFNNKPQVFAKIIAALSKPEFQIIVSAGGAFAALAQKTWPDNVMIFPSVPQVDLLPHVDMVIGHGGNNSTNETLAAGKPLLILPVGGEQHDNARRIEYLEAGLWAEIESFSEEEIASKVLQIKNHKAYQEKAQYYQKKIEETQGPVTASSLIAWVARHQKPLTRPHNFPLTVTSDNLRELLRVSP
jgi:MGT family glycosyltransferase